MLAIVSKNIYLFKQILSKSEKNENETKENKTNNEKKTQMLMENIYTIVWSSDNEQ